MSRTGAKRVILIERQRAKNLTNLLITKVLEILRRSLS